MYIMYINNATGNREERQVPEGTTVQSFLSGENVNFDGSLVRVNSDIAPATRVLKPGDSVLVTPMKMKAAAQS